jgi:hypothetical protein
MPKQMRLSKDFFVNASENEARQHILQLPNCITNIKFVEENQVRRSFRFVYEQPTQTPEANNFIEVSLLPLNVHQTRITLHGFYINGNASQKDYRLTNALCNFESAVHAVVGGVVNEYVPQQINMGSSLNLRIILALIGLAGALYLLKHLF